MLPEGCTHLLGVSLGEVPDIVRKHRKVVRDAVMLAETHDHRQTDTWNQGQGRQGYPHTEQGQRNISTGAKFNTECRTPLTSATCYFSKVKFSLCLIS
jgi:hypothetical protein